MNERERKRKRETESGARPNRFTPSLLAVMVMHTVHMCVRMHPPSLSRSLARDALNVRAEHTRENDAFSLFFSSLSSFLSSKAHTYNTRTYAYAQHARARETIPALMHAHVATSYTVEKRNLIRLSRLSSREERAENFRTRGKNTRETRTTESKRWRRILSRSLFFSSVRRSRFDREIRNVTARR